MSEVTDRIKSRGYWEVSIRPLPYQLERVEYGDLLELLQRTAVRMRGWPVPFIDHREEPIRSDQWIGQDIDATMVFHQEAWRFFMSGQFSQLRVISADWREGNEGTLVPAGYDSVIEVWEVLFYLTEIFELASRMALGPAGDEQMSIEVRLNGLENRGLVIADHRRSEFFQPYRSQLPNIERAVALSRDELVTEGRAHAVALSRNIFQRFGWDASTELLSDYQRELTDRS